MLDTEPAAPCIKDDGAAPPAASALPDAGAQPDAPVSDAVEIAASFSAFKTRLSQGKELKALKRDLAAHQRGLAEMRATYGDNCAILRDFEAIVGPLHETLEANAKLEEAARTSIVQLESSIAQAAERLKELQESNTRERAPESEALYAANRVYAEERQAVKEAKRSADMARKAAKAQGASGPSEALSAAMDALDAAQDAHLQAKEAQDKAQRAYDAKAGSHGRSEDAVAGEIERLEGEKAALLEELEELQKKSARAMERIERCEWVLANPQETEELGEAIRAAEREEAEMHVAIAALEDEHDSSKRSSALARNILAALVGVVIFVALGTFLGYLFT